jgi:predicted HAD superfamily Cof-like phosphohydrolase
VKRTLVQGDELVENTIEDQLDALADVIVFAVGAMVKLKANPNCVMDETLKEIESRTGEIIDGKFVKDLTGTEYTANYKLCLKDNDAK